VTTVGDPATVDAAEVAVPAGRTVVVITLLGSDLVL
jgi:hypothetical protein